MGMATQVAPLPMDVQPRGSSQNTMAAPRAPPGPPRNPPVVDREKVRIVESSMPFIYELEMQVQ